MSFSCTAGQPETFEGRGGFRKLGHTFFAVLKVKDNLFQNSFKNNLFQIQKVLVNIPVRAYNFKNPQQLQTFLRRKIKCYVYHPIPYNWRSFSIGDQTVAIMDHCCYYFDSPWKVKALYAITMSRAHFRVNLHSVVPWMSRDAFLETGTISKI